MYNTIPFNASFAFMSSSLVSFWSPSSFNFWISAYRESFSWANCETLVASSDEAPFDEASSNNYFYYYAFSSVS
jgi:hypothetical protein